MLLDKLFQQREFGLVAQIAPVASRRISDRRLSHGSLPCKPPRSGVERIAGDETTASVKRVESTEKVDAQFSADGETSPLKRHLESVQCRAAAQTTGSSPAG